MSSKNENPLRRCGTALWTPRGLGILLLGTAVLSFGLYNVHRQAELTEGGVLGLILLLDHWFGLSPAISSPALDALCYLAAFAFLGRDFLKLSLVSTLSLAGFFFLWEQFPPLLPDLSAYPLAAAVAGALFVGLGVGLVVREGGSTGGDDALALAIAKRSGCRLWIAYLATDLTVLLLSLTYLPLTHILYSALTVSLSSLLIDWVKTVSFRPAKKPVRQNAADSPRKAPKSAVPSARLD